MKRENEMYESQWAMLFMHDIKQKMETAWECLPFYSNSRKKVNNISAGRLISNILDKRLSADLSILICIILLL